MQQQKKGNRSKVLALAGTKDSGKRYIANCDRPRENRPSSHLEMIVEIPVLKIVISITSFCSC